jgi:membrane protein implicated in regulation of membrane protease activity
MHWWSWIVLGAILLGSELAFVDAQFYLVFVGCAALIVGLASLAGVLPAPWMQWATFGVLALVFMFTFRRGLYERMRARLPIFKDGILGGCIEMPAVLEPHKSARVEYRGSSWNCHNTGEQAIAAGGQAEIVRVDGLTLIVRVKP